MEMIRTFIDSENIEYLVFNDGRYKFRMKDLDAGEVITLIICPTIELAMAKFNEATKLN
jgi:hypothetical protein